MRIKGLRSVLVGGTVGAVVAAGGVAVAGTGVGGVFNLGQVNSVNATTTLTGTTAGPQLTVRNDSTNAAATPLSLKPAAGIPGLSVTNTTLIKNLNSQYVGGMGALDIGRIGMANDGNLFGASATDTRTTVSITARRAGFVRLDGTIIFYDGFSSAHCAACYAFVYVHDVEANADSPMTFASLTTDGPSHGVTIPISWVFPVAAGTHSFTLATAQSALSGGPAVFYNPVLIAQYVAAGSTGSSTSLGTSATPTAADSKAEPTQSRDGTTTRR
jgi:hypothetical protein